MGGPGPPSGAFPVKRAPSALALAILLHQNGHDVRELRRPCDQPGVRSGLATVRSMDPALGDRPNATNWVPGATGTYGISWTPGIIAGPTRLTLVPPDGLDVVTVDVPIEDGAITFATVAIP